jgi:hypothetical protein
MKAKFPEFGVPIEARIERFVDAMFFEDICRDEWQLANGLSEFRGHASRSNGHEADSSGIGRNLPRAIGQSGFQRSRWLMSTGRYSICGVHRGKHQATNLGVGNSNLSGRASFIKILANRHRTKQTFSTVFSTANFRCRAGVPKPRFPARAPRSRAGFETAGEHVSCPPKARVKPAGVKSEEERVFEYNGLRGMRVGA